MHASCMSSKDPRALPGKGWGGVPPPMPAPLPKEVTSASSRGVSSSVPGVKPRKLLTARPRPMPTSMSRPKPTSVCGAMPGDISDKTCGGLPTESPGEVLTPWQGKVAAHNAIWGSRRWSQPNFNPCHGDLPLWVRLCAPCSCFLPSSVFQDLVCVSEDSSLCISSTSVNKCCCQQSIRMSLL